MAGSAFGFVVSVAGPAGWDAGVADGFGVAVGLTEVFAAGALGVGVAFGGVSSVCGIGTRITAPSFGMNTLPPFGSTVTV